MRSELNSPIRLAEAVVWEWFHFTFQIRSASSHACCASDQPSGQRTGAHELGCRLREPLLPAAELAGLTWDAMLSERRGLDWPERLRMRVGRQVLADLLGASSA